MIKIIVLLVGLAIGFGAGVYWGVKNPEQAKTLAAAEERKVLEKQKELLQKMKAKLDQLASSRVGTTAKGVGSGFVSGAQTGAAKANAKAAIQMYSLFISTKISRNPAPSTLRMPISLVRFTVLIPERPNSPMHAIAMAITVAIDIISVHCS